jgi:hypothetical protein
MRLSLIIPPAAIRCVGEMIAQDRRRSGAELTSGMVACVPEVSYANAERTGGAIVDRRGTHRWVILDGVAAYRRGNAVGYIRALLF